MLVLLSGPVLQLKSRLNLSDLHLLWLHHFRVQLRATLVDDEPKALGLLGSRWLGCLQVPALDTPSQNDCSVRRHTVDTTCILLDLVRLAPACLVARLQVRSHLEVRLLLCNFILQI